MFCIFLLSMIQTHYGWRSSLGQRPSFYMCPTQPSSFHQKLDIPLRRWSLKDSAQWNPQEVWALSLWVPIHLQEDRQLQDPAQVTKTHRHSSEQSIQLAQVWRCFKLGFPWVLLVSYIQFNEVGQAFIDLNNSTAKHIIHNISHPKKVRSWVQAWPLMIPLVQKVKLEFLELCILS